MSRGRVIPGWTRVLAQRAERDQHLRALSQLAELQELLFATLDHDGGLLRLPRPGQIEAEAARAAGLGRINPWPWDRAKAELARWRNELDQAA
ncbi:hypothetical protein [Mycobacterium ostraviense]|uniref:Uncharacterized protein n=1 Tax=Mycobacterium ostraviense TaxID=2738409 RepID=A0A164B313_9MYCO|nr:hypothetical protein [Mycobacterium ostraviense]KZS63061.1 hypothetical protein A4G28_04305 [Mycobacterium ostraviense]